MNIEITENIIRGSIIYALHNKFGDSYKYYDENIDQGFEKPSFHVFRFDAINKKGYTGNEYSFENTSYRFRIKYFSNENYKVVEDNNNKIDDLKQLFKYLEIVNIDGDKVYSKSNRVNQIEYITEDGVLIFDLLLDIRTLQHLEISKVKANVLTEDIK